ncbi:dipeptidase [Carboxydothermus pertinax]|uniref:Peptidase n=1 Tax=Carboxydothermus pertinax TaxID=870242 RepID=A0A1L8CW92_9THEO|nr:dipeptidase [Carboxydothermus pertinax]GAV23119.1 hypothetical protein cpu_16290 [Carboxydothermus pertinax]
MIIDCHLDSLLFYYNKRQNFFKEICLDAQANWDSLKKMDAIPFLAIYIEEKYKPTHAWERFLEIYHFYREDINNHCRLQEKPRFYLSIEGGEVLENSLLKIEVLKEMGIIALTLTWNYRNLIADGVLEKNPEGLTNFGRKVVLELNRQKILIDAAHLAEPGFWDLIELAEKPFLVSHANARALCDHPRNLTDQQIKALAAKGGVIGLSFVPGFVSLTNPDLTQLVAHFVHIAEIAGVEVLALGSDFDGMEERLLGLECSEKYLALKEKLQKAGFTSEEIEKIFYKNIARVLEEVLY